MPSEEKTLKQALSCLCEQYGLPEVLDRLAEIVDSNGDDWSQVTRLLEDATTRSLELKSKED